MKKIKKFFEEFKKFITKGNVIDLAVAVVIGAAFNKIISSFVADIISPLIAAATGSATIADLSVTIGTAELRWGNFLQTVIDFIVIGFVVFIMVKIFNRAKAVAEKVNNKVEDTAKLLISKIKKEENETPLENKEDTVKENIESPVEKTDAATHENVKPTVEELLTEIRDLLKSEQK